MWNRINADDLLLCGHGVNHHPIDPALEWFIYTGTAIKEHIQNLCRRFIWILWVQNAVAALEEVSPGRLFRSLHHA